MNLDSLRQQVDLIEPERAVAVAMLDLDDFAEWNAAVGMEAGDGLLARFEAVLQESLPEQAIVAHVRGDEFAAAMPDAPPEALLIALEGARRAIGDSGTVKVSAGVAGRPQHGTSIEELLSAADTALVRSKKDGGNRISIAIEGPMLLKTSYYPPAALYRLAKMAQRTGRPEASLLREALDDLIVKHADLL
jgi:diguanylate cyclase